MGREGCGAGYADLCSKAGKDAIRLSGYTWHSNRHTFASRLVTSAWSLARYSRLAPEFLGEAADRLVVTGSGDRCGGTAWCPPCTPC